jgi:dipeptidyl aminopeptidase/acylaminoacyl peptidase
MSLPGLRADPETASIVGTLASRIGAPAPVEIAVDPSARHLAVLTRAGDLRRDAFTTRLHLLEARRGGPVTRWQTERPGARSLRFSPMGTHLAFLAQAADRPESVCVTSLGSADAVIAAESLEASAAFTWMPDGGALIVAALRPRPDDDVLVATTIPGRLPWSRSSTDLRLVSFSSASPAKPLCRVPDEVEHLAVSPDGRWLAFARPECRDGLSEEHVLRQLELSTLRETAPVPLRTPVLGSLAFSPGGRYVAYIGGRQLRLGHHARGVNRYDTRVCVVDLDHPGRSWMLSAGAALSAGIPVGLAPAQQEICWHDDDRLTFVATCGHVTALATQSIRDDASLVVEPLGCGASRSHAFAADGSCVLLHSEHGAPFAPARWTRDGGLDRLRADGVVPLTGASAAPRVVSDVPAAAAWLAVPHDQSGESHPLVVWIYGGATPLQMAYDETQHALLARGFAVLVVNPSGCAGYGPDVADRHVGDLGQRSVGELLETVRLVLDRHPELDRERIGICGGSFGGFLAMRALTESELFSAGASLAGFANVASYWAGSRTGYEYGRSALGDARPWSQPELFVDRSPVFHADRISAPLLLLHGECDGVVPAEESHQMFVALRTLGRPVALVVVPNEDHAMRSRPSARVASQRYVLAWFDRFLRHDPREWDAAAAGMALGPDAFTEID